MYSNIQEKLKSLFKQTQRSGSMQIPERKTLETARKSTLDARSKHKEEECKNHQKIEEIFNLATSKKETRAQHKGKGTSSNQILNPESFQSLIQSDRTEKNSNHRSHLTFSQCCPHQVDKIGCNDAFTVGQCNLSDKELTKGSFQDHQGDPKYYRDAKQIFNKNSSSNADNDIKEKRPRTIAYKCIECGKRIQIQESIQLACTHRIHLSCRPQMICRNNYECKFCTKIRKLKR